MGAFSLIKRLVLGRELSYAEGDQNFTDIEQQLNLLRGQISGDVKEDDTAIYNNLMLRATSDFTVANTLNEIDTGKWLALNGVVTNYQDIKQDLNYPPNQTYDYSVNYIIPDGVTIVVHNDAVVNITGDLTIQSGGTLEIRNGGTVTKTGTLTNNGTLINNGTLT